MSNSTKQLEATIATRETRERLAKILLREAAAKVEAAKNLQPSPDTALLLHNITIELGTAIQSY